MQVIETLDELTRTLEKERATGRAVGLVPTMGALHTGHLSLVERARAECETVVTTIFVNPLQFNSSEDLASYPRDDARDVELARAAGAAYVFLPAVEEMYPGPVLTSVQVSGLTEGFEGASRPGHFEGVATVVAKLFAAVGRCRAYFGEKDYQQLLVVRRLVSDLSFPVDIVGCETVRDGDGLALSSRNARLTAEERAAAPVLYRALQAGKSAVESGERHPPRLAAVMAEVVRAEPLVRLDYAAAVDAADLTVPAALVGEVRLLVAAYLGTTRLIDNIGATAR
ncbi:MAG TPA: pantoate--beta-alanine ligase [Acidimicrobiales bacterium]|nr:pantoate--beta-alanine ligase [Acidimicrobiales bacterium]